MRYTIETLSRREMRKCFSRFSFSIILYLLAMEGLSILLSHVVMEYLPRYMNDPQWYPITTIVINEVAVYLPGITLVPLLLHKLPKPPRMPVDRLSPGELFSAIPFILGSVYIASGLTSGAVELLEAITGHGSTNILDTFTNMMPNWLSVVVTVILAPVFEELIFRKIAFEPLRSLGDLPAVLLTSLAFAMIHTNLYQMLYAFTAGFVLSCVVLLTGSIRDAIALHAVVNGFSLLVDYAPSLEYNTVLGVVIMLCVISVPVSLARSVGKYHMEPGPLPFKSGEKLRACLTSFWFWIMLVSGLGGSVLLIFM